MIADQECLLTTLATGTVSWFADWPDPQVPRIGSLVYTIWNREGRFIYVGMAGRGSARSSNGSGPFGRLGSHASGRRSGDQFCIYVCDRLVLPGLQDRLGDIATGVLLLDRLTRGFVREQLGYRWVGVADGTAALVLERSIQREGLNGARPLLNPLPSL